MMKRNLLFLILLIKLLYRECCANCQRVDSYIETGRRCRKLCTSDSDCRGLKRCHCDGVCGMTCFNKMANCLRRPQPPRNGYVALTGMGWGSRAYYSCDEGFVVVGERSRTCYADKKWSPQAPTCKGGCQTPGDVPHSYPAYGGRTHLGGETHGFACRTGYYVIGSPNRICHKTNLTWSDAEFSCHPQQCSVIEEVPNGSIHYTEERRFTSIATLQCLEGFQKSGSENMTCGAGRAGSQFGNWEGSLPSCINLADCGQAGASGIQTKSISRIVGGQNAEKNAWPWQVLITKRGNTLEQTLSKYNLRGGGSLLNTNWVLTAAHIYMQAKDELASFVISVGVLERPSGSEKIDDSVQMFTPSSVYTHEKFRLETFENDIALFKIGRRLDSSMTEIKNDASGVTFALNARPVCMPCNGALDDDQLDDEHGNSLIVDNMQINEKCFREEMFLLGSNQQVVVTGFGHLNISHGPRIRHPNIPKVLQQATLTLENENVCRRGIEDINEALRDRRLFYSNKMLCTTSIMADACSGDSGGPLVRKVTNENTDKTHYVQVGIVSFGYGCGTGIPGFYTNLARYIQWINATIERHNKACTAPKNVSNGYPSTFKTTFGIGEVVTYNCRKGYHMNDKRMAGRRCTASGWTPERFYCSVQTCSELSTMDNARILYSKGRNLGTIATLECKEGYILPKSGTKVKCNSSPENSRYGEWSGSLSSCIIKTCGSPKDPEHGEVINRHWIVLEYGQEINYRCNDGYKLMGPNRGRCGDSGTWGPIPKCAVEPDCDFSEYSRPTCAFTNKGNGWDRFRTTERSGFAGYVARARHSGSKLISPKIPADWTFSEYICLKFDYYLFSGSLSVNSVPGSRNLGIRWQSHDKEVSGKWLDAILNIDTSTSFQYEFKSINSAVYLDNIEVAKEKCEEHCKWSTCRNGGTCVNRKKTYTCFCATDFIGSNCETDLKCSKPNSIIPNGKITTRPAQQNMLLAGSTAKYTCNVNYKLRGYVEIVTTLQTTCYRNRERSYWYPDPSRYSFGCIAIICTKPPLKSYQDIVGGKSEWKVDETVTVKCADGYGFSESNPSTILTCGADERWRGTTTPCRDIDECSSNPCLNGAICNDRVAGFLCECPPGYEGKTCNTDIDECSSNPCLNGAICNDRVAGFLCLCPPGYEGKTCNTNTKCIKPPGISNGRQLYLRPAQDNLLLVGSTAAYICNANYRIQGRRTSIRITCRRNASGSYWSPSLSRLKCTGRYTKSKCRRCFA